MSYYDTNLQNKVLNKTKSRLATNSRAENIATPPLAQRILDSELVGPPSYSIVRIVRFLSSRSSVFEDVKKLLDAARATLPPDSRGDTLGESCIHLRVYFRQIRFEQNRSARFWRGRSGRVGDKERHGDILA